MLIIDLNSSGYVKSQKKSPEPVLVIRPAAKPVPVQVKPELVPFTSAPKIQSEPDEKERLLRQLSDEDARVRIERSKWHQRYFDLLTPDLLPKPNADFSEIYEQMDVMNHELQLIWIKRQQVEKYGTLKSANPVTKEQLTQLSALKHERSNAYKNLSKWQKKLAEATAKNIPAAITGAKSKIDDIELNIFDLSHQINQLSERVKIAR